MRTTLYSASQVGHLKLVASLILSNYSRARRVATRYDKLAANYSHSSNSHLAFNANLLDEGSQDVSQFRIRHQPRAFDDHASVIEDKFAANCGWHQ
jgi:hypothetical protein